MKEFAVTGIAAIETPHTVTETGTGKTFSLVCLEITLRSPHGAELRQRLLFPPTLLQQVIPKLQATIQMALTQPTEPGTRH